MQFAKLTACEQSKREILICNFEKRCDALLARKMKMLLREINYVNGLHFYSKYYCIMTCHSFTNKLQFQCNFSNQLLYCATRHVWSKRWHDFAERKKIAMRDV